MAFDGTEGSAITLPAASTLTKEHRTRNPSALKGHFFGKVIINQILEQEGCMGIRIYHGVDPDSGKRELVLVGADENGDDILELVADFSVPCPSTCSDSNTLNS